ncbi:hypothetical protein SALBM311S_04544 [Streptomyces alboniger]
MTSRRGYAPVRPRKRSHRWPEFPWIGYAASRVRCWPSARSWPSGPQRKASMRAGENAGPQLGEAVQERLTLRGAEKDTVQWDSWRRDDGTSRRSCWSTWSRANRTRRAGRTTRPGGSSRPSTRKRARSSVSPTTSRPRRSPAFPSYRASHDCRAIVRWTAPSTGACRRGPRTRRRDRECECERTELARPACWRRCRASGATWWSRRAPFRGGTQAEEHRPQRARGRGAPGYRGPRPVRPTRTSSCLAPSAATATASSAPPTARPRRRRPQGRRAAVPSWDEIVFGAPGRSRSTSSTAHAAQGRRTM